MTPDGAGQPPSLPPGRDWSSDDRPGAKPSAAQPRGGACGFWARCGCWCRAPAAAGAGRRSGSWPGTDGSLFGGALPTPDRVWAAWKVWAFGTPGMGLNPYSGTWRRQRAVLGAARRQGLRAGHPGRRAARHPDRLVAAGGRPRSIRRSRSLRPIPITAWLPFSIAIFGIRDFGAIFLIALGAFYPIVINTTQGARDVERNWIRAALMMGAARIDILRRVVLPAAAAVDLHGPAHRARHRLDGGDRLRDGRGEVRPRLRAVGRLLRRPHGRRHRRHGRRSALLGFLSRPADRRCSNMWVLRWRRLQIFHG